MRRFPVFAAVLMLAGNAVAAAPEPALPQTNNIPLPQAGSWVIGPIANTKICSMKNTWQGGRRLVFARDAAGTNSLAIDYGADVLQPGKQYPVTLDLPPVVTRELNAVGATRQVLLVGMGTGDKQFYDALGNMKALYVAALGHDDGYVMTGSGEALQELAACAAGLHGTSAPVAVKAARPPKVAKAKKSAPVADTALASENAALRRQLAAAQAKARSAETEKDKLEVTLSAAREEQDKAAALKKQLAAAEVEKSRLKANLAEAKAKPAVMQTSIKTMLETKGGARDTRTGRTFRWQAEDVLGSAEETPLKTGETFAGKVTKWLDRMASRCKGDFAHKDGAVLPQGGVTTQTTEIACVGETASGAALLFVGDASTFSAVMYETAPENMPAAVAQRDAALAAAR